MPATDLARHQRSLVDQLRRSQIYRDYEKAFRETTGMPLALSAREMFGLPLHGDPNENPFCAQMAGRNHSCAACLQFQGRLRESSTTEPQTQKCFAGLCDAAVPVRIGENLIGYLHTGQVLMQHPSAAHLSKLSRLLLQMDPATDVKLLEASFLQSRVVTAKQYKSIVQLLAIFAQHLSTISNQIAVREEGQEAPVISRARTFIAEHHAEEISLTEVARAVNMSAFYFCKSFRKATGLTYTDYLARVRVEKVKELLLDVNKRVSEAAYEAGFQSLSQFNRVFRRVSGESPSTYRDKIHRAA
jgi:AraC-like DNA-binding protein/ligand-binding sensor protein